MHAKAKLLSLDQRRCIQLLGLMYMHRNNRAKTCVYHPEIPVKQIGNCFMSNVLIIVNTRTVPIIKAQSSGKHYLLILHVVLH